MKILSILIIYRIKIEDSVNYFLLKLKENNPQTIVTPHIISIIPNYHYPRINIIIYKYY